MDRRPQGPLIAVFTIKLTYINNDTEATATPKRMIRKRRAFLWIEDWLLSFSGTGYLTY